jgi:hypothetical protein
LLDFALRPNRKRWYAVCMESAIAYLRVSTQRQQRSGLGLEAQRATIARFAEAEGLSIIGEYLEAETGKVPTRSIAGLSWPPLWLLPSQRNAAWSFQSAWKSPLLIVCMLSAMLFAKLAQHQGLEVAEAEAVEVTGSTTQ